MPCKGRTRAKDAEEVEDADAAEELAHQETDRQDLGASSRRPVKDSNSSTSINHVEEAHSAKEKEENHRRLACRGGDSSISNSKVSRRSPVRPRRNSSSQASVSAVANADTLVMTAELC